MAKKYTCKNCNKDFAAYEKQRGYCSQKCYGEAKASENWPSNDELSKLVWQKPLRHIAKDLEVTAAAVIKHCEKHCIEKPPTNYFKSIEKPYMPLLNIEDLKKALFEGMNVTQLADKFKTNRKRVVKDLNHYGLTTIKQAKLNAYKENNG